MPSPSAPSWRKIETALVSVARTYGYTLDQDGLSGDMFCYVHITADPINLTNFARELEERL